MVVSPVRRPAGRQEGLCFSNRVNEKIIIHSIMLLKGNGVYVTVTILNAWVLHGLNKYCITP
jgi:hypothetical protein